MGFRYRKPNNSATRIEVRRNSRTGAHITHTRKPRMYKGFEITNTGIGYHHIYFNGKCVDRGLATFAKAREMIDFMVPYVKGL